MNTKLKHFKDQLKRTGIIATVSGKEHRVITANIDDKNKFLSMDVQFLYIETNIIKQGDIITIDNSNYMVIDLFKNDYDKAVILKSNTIIKMGLDRKLQSFNINFLPIGKQEIQEGKVIGVPIGDIKVTIPKTPITDKIEEGKRFIKFGTAWKVESKTEEHEGLLYLYCKKDAINPTEDIKELEIANKEDVDVLRITSTDVTLKENATAKIEAKYLKNDVVIENIPFIYTTNNKNIIVDSGGLITPVNVGITIVTISSEDTKATITVTVEEASALPTYTITAGTDSIYKGTDLTVNITNTAGGDVTGNYTWEIINPNANVTKYVSISAQDNLTCTIKIASKASGKEKFVLRATGDNGIVLEKELEYYSRIL